MRNALGIALIAALIVILLGSDRDWFLSDQHRAVAHVADIPKGPGKIRDSLEWTVAAGGVHIAKLTESKAAQIVHALVPGSRDPDPDAHDRWPRLGYEVREWTFLGMPFGYYSELGYVAYNEDADELVAAPLIEPAWAQLASETGGDLRRKGGYPFWQSTWGWLFVAGLLLWAWLRHRWVVRTREEQGLI